MIGLGANLGDAHGALERTLRRLRDDSRVQVASVSSVWRSAPVDATGPDFLNAVVAFDTQLDPQTLLALAQGLEFQEGRQRPYQNAPRTLDVDLLCGESLTLATDTLTLPHPRMHLRAFVLQPLLEIDPQACIPGQGSAAEWLARITDQPIERIGALLAASAAQPREVTSS
ncbi:MAG: 2-amino-4-hydroxy-6-hydroxymethyldihydropteridine diphosphokinase [Betaproteobacteria bacterium]